MPGLRVVVYLALSAGSGVVIGSTFGAFARAPFHYPLRMQDVSATHRALLAALDVVEWPLLFGLTLACALALWALFRPRPPSRVPAAAPRAVVFVTAGLAALGALVSATSASEPGREIAALLGGVLGAIAAGLILSLWREAVARPGPVGGRWLRQLPLAAGHLFATSTAAMSLGYRGESSLIQGFMLVIGVGLFCAVLVLALVVALLASSVRGGSQETSAGSRS